ncbi:MAG: glycosyltransferase family 2 protein [Planctomycetota bacterium]|jgi:glycosyltransferase involved in cell wall biosynthesis|nr:glycosyltransferase family 2 protein [Planctomycetota bacterium]
MRTAALIPAYREEKHIADVVHGTRRHVGHVLVVDDGSNDGTAAAATDAGAEVFRNPVNLGKGASLTLGLNRLFAEGYAAVVCLDADGQHLPDEIPRFLDVAERVDLVIGNRMMATGKMPRIRKWTNQSTSRIVSRLAGTPVSDVQCGFRLIRSEAWRGVVLKGRNYDLEAEMVVAMGRKGFRIAQVPVTAVYGNEKSAIRPMLDTWRFFSMVWRLWREGGA